MDKKIQGKISQFGTKGYGFIEGDDGEKYFVHQKNIFNKSRLAVHTPVVFTPQDSEKGLVAIEVELAKAKTEAKPLTDTMIKAMFLFLLFMQIVTAYYVFIAPAIQ